jgi:hypothetical protein
MYYVKNLKHNSGLFKIPFRIVCGGVFLISAMGVCFSAAQDGPILPTLLIFGVTLYACICLLAVKRGQRLSGLSLGPDALILGLLGTGVFLSGIYLACNKSPNLIGLVANSHTEVLWYAFKALFLCYLGLAGFALGYYTLPLGNYVNYELGENLKMNRVALNIALAFAAFGVLVVLQYIRVRGGLVSFMQIWNDRDTLFQMPIYDRLIAALPMASILILCAPMRSFPYALIASSLTFVTMVSMYATGGRHNVLRFCFACFVALLFTPRFNRFIRKHSLFICIAGLLLFLFVYLSVGVFRGAAGARLFGGGEFFSDAYYILGKGNIFNSLLSAYYLPSLIPVSMSVYTFPSVFGYVGGASFLAALDVYVPRFMWSDFPDYQIGKVLRSSIYRDDADSGLYASYIGELWANFSYVGPFLGMLFLGLFARLVLTLVSINTANPLSRAFYAITFGSAIPMFLVVNAKPAAFYTVFLYIFLLLAWIPFLLLASNAKNRNSQSKA